MIAPSLVSEQQPGTFQTKVALQQGNTERILPNAELGSCIFYKVQMTKMPPHRAGGARDRAKLQAFCFRGWTREKWDVVSAMQQSKMNDVHTRAV